MKSVSIKITIALICSLLFATQANAYEIATPVNPTGRTWEWGSGASFVWTTQQGGVEYPNTTTIGDAIFLDISAGNNSAFNTWILKAVAKDVRIDFKAGYYYKTQLSFNFGGGDKYGVQMPQLNRLVEYDNAPFRLMNISPSYSQCYEKSAGAYNITGMAGNTGGGDTTTWSGCMRGYITYDIIVQATRTETGVFQLGDGRSWFIQMEAIKDLTGGAHSLRVGTLRPLTIMEFESIKVDSINQQQQQAGQQAQQDGQNASSNAQQQTEQQTATAFQTIGNILGAITDTPPGDCSITGNMGHLDMGNLNLCQAEIEPLRPIIRAVLYLVMALATYKIMMWVLGAMAGLINWVQTGNEGKEDNG